MEGVGRKWPAGGEGAMGFKILAAIAMAAVVVGGLVASQYSSELLLGFQGRLGGAASENKDKRKKAKNKKRPVRVYMDGCFDMMHYGHANALRQARALGDELVVGVVSDEEIQTNKGPTVMSMQERVAMVSAVKWVDEIIEAVPYAINEEFMNKLFTDYGIDYIIHGDDPCLLPDGSDAYAHAKKAGRYKQIKRTEGVSSTDIVGRMLLCVRDRGVTESPVHTSLQRQFSNGFSSLSHDSNKGSLSAGVGTRYSHFLPTSRRIVQFSNKKVAIQCGHSAISFCKMWRTIDQQTQKKKKKKIMMTSCI
jgi:ethanolamine-phosphate cytidylyltransferase